MAPNYRDRRYRVIDGRLQKQFEVPPPDGWYVTKAEALEAWNEAVASAPEPSQAATTSTGYGKRRYKIVAGKLAKKWDSDPSWFTTKVEAWAAHATEVAEEQARQAATVPPEAASAHAPPETPKIAPQINKPRPLIDGGRVTVTAPEPAVEVLESEPDLEPGPNSAEVVEVSPATELPPESAPELDPPDLAAARTVLRVRAVTDQTGLSRTTIYRKVKTGQFPQPLDLGNGHIGWLETEISAWQRDQSAAAQAPELEAAT